MRFTFAKITGLLEHYLRIDAKYFVSSGSWLVLAQVGTTVTSLIVAVVFANILTEVEFGNYRYIVELAAILTFFSLTGMGQSVLQATAKGYTGFLKYSIKWTTLYGLGIAASALFCSGYYFWNNNEFLGLGCLMIAVFHPISVLLPSTIAYLHGSKRFKEATWMQISRALFVSSSSIAAIIFTKDVAILLLVYFLSQALSSLTSYLFLKQETPVTTPKEEARKYLRFAHHTSIRGVVVGFASRLDAIIVFQQLGAVSLAVYSISTLIPDQIRGSFKSLLILLLPKYARYGTIGELKKHIPKRSIQFFLLLTGTSLVFIAVIPLVYEVLFPKYVDSVVYAQLLALGFPASIHLLPLTALQSQLKEKELYQYHFLTAAFQISLILILIFTFGLIGAIVARITTQYLRTILSFYLVFRKTKHV